MNTSVAGRKTRDSVGRSTAWAVSAGRGGFSLVELLVVIVIISVLIALLLPALAAARFASNGVVCQSNMRQIYMSYAQYADENRGMCPPYYVGSQPNAFGSGASADPRYWNYRNVPYLTGHAQVLSTNPDTPYALFHLPSVYICPEAFSLDPTHLGLSYGDGLRACPSYLPNLCFYCVTGVNGTIARVTTPNITYPTEVYTHRSGDATTTVNPADGILLEEANTPEWFNDSGTYPYSWWGYPNSPQNWWGFGPGLLLWPFSSVWQRFGYFHGSYSSSAGGGEVGTRMNVIYFDGHAGSIDFQQTFANGPDSLNPPG